MKKVYFKLHGFVVAFALLFFCIGCSNAKSPTLLKLEELVDRYEVIVERHLPEIEKTKGNPFTYTTKMMALSADLTAWTQEWSETSLQANPKELEAIEARLDALNKKLSAATDGL